MPDAATTADPACASPPPKAAKPNPFGDRMLALVRDLIAYGRDMLASLQACEGPHPPLETFRRFGCLSLTLVIARITRGLITAGVLEERFLHRLPNKKQRPARPQREPAPEAGTDAPRPPRQRRTMWSSRDEELEGSLPTAEEIAARLKGRPAGSVITEICRDLGINTRHPLWREINELLCWCHPFNLCRMMEAWRERGERFLKADPTLASEMGIYPPPAAATHPP